ncbi:MAG TPA: ECF-type sigma factor [Blastocatellia bacterium]|nr:ECF-type sigma factor [Blastocatellia bacterium]HMV86627.1 ECF-type sigma factor [Blastocatellia bacterium]HMY76667.1 ECF-type sigma factor [Blastocatellia bacterium]HMZ21463.1 ECF-type sigma factor [Blastocatellia bacterium]HNG31799.1 ECF-type sigma factor [Blastocatellia bacterium]
MEHSASQLLLAWDSGDEEAFAQLVPLVQRELHRLARLYLSRKRPNHSLQPTDLLNQAYANLLIWKPVGLKNRAHFIGVVANLMRNVLRDNAVEYRKRGIRVSLTEADQEAQEIWAEIEALDDALTDLGRRDPLKVQLIELRFFSGLTMKEVAEILDTPLRTLEREWEFAKNRLKSELDKRKKKDDS